MDKRLHPFVYAHADDSKTHNRLEFMLDAWYIRDIKNINAADFDIAGDLYKDKLSVSISDWYGQMLKKVYDLDSPRDAAIEAHQRFAVLRKRLRQPGIGFYTLAFLVYLLTKKDPRIFLHPKKITEDYFTKEEYEGVKKMIEEASDEAIEKIDFFLDYISGRLPLETVVDTLENINFKGEAL